MSTHFSGKVKALDVNVDYKITDFEDEEEYNQVASSDEKNIQIVDNIKENNIDKDFLADISKKDALFPDIDYKIYM